MPVCLGVRARHPARIKYSRSFFGPLGEFGTLNRYGAVLKLDETKATRFSGLFVLDKHCVDHLRDMTTFEHRHGCGFF